MTTTDYKTVPAVGDAVHALLELLTPIERASLAGSILAKDELTGDVVEAFTAELTEDQLVELAEQIGG